jgi:hypothetical protein
MEQQIEEKQSNATWESCLPAQLYRPFKLARSLPDLGSKTFYQEDKHALQALETGHYDNLRLFCFMDASASAGSLWRRGLRSGTSDAGRRKQARQA